MLNIYHRDEVFTAGGQPTVTYVERENQDVEKMLARAIATPNHIVSVSGPTKTGKTVLCKKVLGSREYVWVDGGKIKTADDFWKIITSELKIPTGRTSTTGSETGIAVEGGIPLITTASGSQILALEEAETYSVDTMGQALSIMTKRKIVLVIDDFHYIPLETRTEIIRNIKGAVFNGMKVLLLSATHRVYDAIEAEPELTGRFTAVSLPDWDKHDLEQIPIKGFSALNVTCSADLIERLCQEAQDNPFLMQQFCWEICFDFGIEKTGIVKKAIPDDYDLEGMCNKLARDAGLPIYKKLAAGPQNRKLREKRPLKGGSEVDIYQATLLAIANTGPKQTISYEELRTVMNALLADRMPQKHEITSALIQLTKISDQIGATSAIDWNEDSREITVADPYLRFYLRWQVRNK